MFVNHGCFNTYNELRFFKSSAKSVPCLMAQVESSLTFIGIANLECAVLPPVRSRDAIPLEATVNTISPLERIAADKVFQMNVFPVPPCP